MITHRYTRFGLVSRAQERHDRELAERERGARAMRDALRAVIVPESPAKPRGPLLLPAGWINELEHELGARRPVSLADCGAAVARIEARHRTALGFR